MCVGMKERSGCFRPPLTSRHPVKAPRECVTPQQSDCLVRKRKTLVLSTAQCFTMQARFSTFIKLLWLEPLQPKCYFTAGDNVCLQLYGVSPAQFCLYTEAPKVIS